MRELKNFGLRTRAIVGETPLTKATGKKDLLYCIDTPQEEIDFCLNCPLDECNKDLCHRFENFITPIKEQKRQERQTRENTRKRKLKLRLN